MSDGAATTARNQLTPNWWKIGDGLVLLAYSAVVLWTLPYHEKWADEAQAWLIARDLNLKTIWFHEMRYEGTPALWHTILWVAQRVFHAGYGAIGYIGAFFAIAGAAVLLFKAPFPRFIRWLLVFGYVIVYQYAVIARPYTLLPLLAFCAAILFKDLRHPERIAVVLVLLALLTVHGAIFGGCLALAYLLEARKSWHELNADVKKRYAVSTAVFALTFVFLFIILKPTPDVQEFATQNGLTQQAALLKANVVTVPMKLEAVFSGAFLDFTIPSVLFAILAGAYCAMRRKFLVYAMPVTALIALYVVVHGYAHHQGTVTIAALAALWIAWPTAEERAAFNVFERRATQGMVLLLLLICGIQIWDSAVAIHHEYLYPYSGAEDAAKFLKSENADKGPIYGFSYGVAGIQAYFDHNIFSNIPTAYFHHGLPLYGKNLDLGEIAQVSPGYIVIFDEDPQRILDMHVVDGLASVGYQMVHFSDGYQLYRRGVYVRQTYFIFKRTGAPTFTAH
ncbi:MAG: hypothetical protein WBL50_08370 [Candidatus Acidiferrum sp.]